MLSQRINNTTSRDKTIQIAACHEHHATHAPLIGQHNLCCKVDEVREGQTCRCRLRVSWSSSQLPSTSAAPPPGPAAAAAAAAAPGPRLVRLLVRLGFSTKLPLSAALLAGGAAAGDAALLLPLPDAAKEN
jgi:hypothetical protein